MMHYYFIQKYLGHRVHLGRIWMNNCDCVLQVYNQSLQVTDLGDVAYPKNRQGSGRFSSADATASDFAKHLIQKQFRYFRCNKHCNV